MAKLLYRDRLRDGAYGALRLMAGLIYAAHGVQKVFGFPVPFTMGVVAPFSLLGASAALELGLGTLIAIGLWTRRAAFLASGHMAVAYFMVHAARGFFPITNGGDEAVLLCFLFLHIAAQGSGRFALRPDTMPHLTTAGA